jgi:uroporphyrinogen-III synthase
MSRTALRPWTVAVTRDEPPEGPLHHALRLQGARPVSCTILESRPPEDPAPLARAVAELASYAWMICASARAVAAILDLRPGPLPRGLRTAAVGAATARALAGAGADPLPVVATDSGSEALTRLLLTLDDWGSRRVLLPRARDGRRDLAERLRASGAVVDEVEAYQMLPRPDGAIVEDWNNAQPDAVVIASPQVAETLARVLGAEALNHLEAVVAIGPTTAAALSDLGITAAIPSTSSFPHAARSLAELFAARG